MVRGINPKAIPPLTNQIIEIHSEIKSSGPASSLAAGSRPGLEDFHQPRIVLLCHVDDLTSSSGRLQIRAFRHSSRLLNGLILTAICPCVRQRTDGPDRFFYPESFTRLFTDSWKMLHMLGSSETLVDKGRRTQAGD